jgi:hypothetical protein
MQESQMRKLRQLTALNSSGAATNQAILLLLFGLLTPFCTSCSLLSDASSVAVKDISPTITGPVATGLPFSKSFDWTKKKIRILPAENWGLFKMRDTVMIETADRSAISVLDLYGRTVWRGHSPAFLHLSCGHYFVECEGDRDEFCVLPNGYDGASFLGCGGYTNVPWGDYQKIQMINPRWIHTFKSSLNQVLPASNRWDWSAMDTVVAVHARRKILATVGDGAPPKWISEPQLLGVFTNYVAALARRYKGKLAGIEIWNEPLRDKFYDDPNWPQLLAQLITQGTKAIKAVDPTIQIMGPTWCDAWSYGDTATLTKLGAMATIDVLTWHDYWAYTYPPDADKADSNGQTRSNVMSRVIGYRQAAGGFDGPLCIDEIGFWGDSALGIKYGAQGASYPPPPSWRVAMARTIKQTVMYRAAGANVIVPQNLVNGCDTGVGFASSLGGWEYGNRGPTPKTSAFLMACHWLQDAKFVGYNHHGTLWEFHWLRRGQPMTFAWSEERYTNPVRDQSVHVKDIYGNPLTEEEVTEMPVMVWGAK